MAWESDGGIFFFGSKKDHQHSWINKRLQINEIIVSAQWTWIAARSFRFPGPSINFVQNARSHHPS